MIKIKWIVFDLGGVVIQVDFNRFFESLPEPLRGVATQKKQLLTAIFRDYEARSGQDLPESVFDQIRQMLGAVVSNDQLIMALNAMLGEPYLSMVLEIERLAKTHSLACLSNTNHIHWEYLQTNYPVMKHFQPQMASHIMGFSKPDPRIYQCAQEILEANPEEILFFDDKPENIEAALAQGWNAHVFVSYDQFIEDCARYGLSKP